MAPPAGMSAPTSSSLDRILQNPHIWRGGQYAKVVLESIPTGHPLLDEQLPGNGWPRAALTEMLVDQQGIGGISLLMPALSTLSRQQEWIALIAPPYIPYAPALAKRNIDLSKVIIINPVSEQERIWAAERCLRSKSCSAVLFWPSRHGGQLHQTYRRLQLAAETGGTWGIVFSPTRQAQQASPAALRLLLSTEENRLRIHLLKRRGGGETADILLHTSHVQDLMMPGSTMRHSGEVMAHSLSLRKQSVA